MSYLLLLVMCSLLLITSLCYLSGCQDFFKGKKHLNWYRCHICVIGGITSTHIFGWWLYGFVAIYVSAFSWNLLCLNLSLLWSNCLLSFIFQIIYVNVSMSSLLFIFLKIVYCCHLFFKSCLLNVCISSNDLWSGKTL